MTFSKALEALKTGGNVSRKGWNGEGMYLELISGYCIPEGELGTRYKDCLLPWIGIRTADGAFVPWVASQTDLLSEDWE